MVYKSWHYFLFGVWFGLDLLFKPATLAVSCPLCQSLLHFWTSEDLYHAPLSVKHPLRFFCLWTERLVLSSGALGPPLKNHRAASWLSSACWVSSGMFAKHPLRTLIRPSWKVHTLSQSYSHLIFSSMPQHMSIFTQGCVCSGRNEPCQDWTHLATQIETNKWLRPFWGKVMCWL